MLHSIWHKILTVAAVFAAVSILCGDSMCAADSGPLAHKGDRQIGVSFGYGYSFGSNRHIRFASIYPYAGWVFTDAIGKGWYRGTLEGIVEGAFSYVHKNQRTYSVGVNALVRYNFLPSTDSLRPFVQAGFGIAYTNLVMHDFGSSFNFSSNASCGVQYFFRTQDAVTFEWKVFHISNAGLHDDNAGINMNNFFIGYSHIY